MNSTRVLRKVINLLFSGALFLTVGIILQWGLLTEKFDPGYIIGKYWPVILIAYGIKYLLLSFISLAVSSKSTSEEFEEEVATLLHGSNPFSAIVWGVGLILLGIILFLDIHEKTSWWNLFFTYWPTLLIIGGMSGILGSISIIFQYEKIRRENVG